MGFFMDTRLDANNRNLEIGLYLSSMSGKFWYFTGKYNDSKNPLFKDAKGNIAPLPSYLVRILIKSKDKEIENKILKLENKTKSIECI